MLRKINQSTVHSVQQSTVKDLSLCLFSAALLILSFPKFNIWLFAWFGFVPLFFALQNKSKTKAFLLSYFTGVIFWSGVIYWLIHVTLPGTIILILYLALYFGFFGLIIYNYEPRTMNYELLFIPSLWVLLEYVRSYLFTGFPWALLGYSQYLNLPIIQIADITGAWGVSFLVMMTNVIIYSFVRRPCLTGRQASSIVREKQKYLLPILCIFISLGYGYYKIHELRATSYELRIKISVIQGNIPQELKWQRTTNDFIINKYINLTTQAAKEGADLVVWPEAALPVVLEEEPLFFNRVKDLARETKTNLLLGAVTLRDNLYYNSALLVSGEGRIVTGYDKLHLVPFGEYIPLKKIFAFLETVVPIGEIAAGKEYTVFTENTMRFSVLICFEDLFPELSRRFVKNGAGFLVNITNDAWYKKTSAAYQHLVASVFRAVENRVTLARAANTGVSGFIGPNGKILSKVKDKFGRNIFVDGFDIQRIPIAEKALSFYTRYGDVFIIICFLFLLYGIISPKKNKR